MPKMISFSFVRLLSEQSSGEPPFQQAQTEPSISRSCRSARECRTSGDRGSIGLCSLQNSTAQGMANSIACLRNPPYESGMKGQLRRGFAHDVCLEIKAAGKM